MWCPLVISWFITPVTICYKYHKPYLLELFAPTERYRERGPHIVLITTNHLWITIIHLLITIHPRDPWNQTMESLQPSPWRPLLHWPRARAPRVPSRWVPKAGPYFVDVDVVPGGWGVYPNNSWVYIIYIWKILLHMDDLEVTPILGNHKNIEKWHVKRKRNKA